MLQVIATQMAAHTVGMQGLRFQGVAGPRVQLFAVPAADRRAFFQGRSIPSTAGLRNARQQRLAVTRAVVAPPKKAKDLAPFEAWNTGAVVKKRTDIKTILILGPGPIVIGQVSTLTIL